MEKRRWFDIEGIRKYTALLIGIGIYWVISKYTPLEQAKLVLPYMQNILYAFMGADVIVHLINRK